MKVIKKKIKADDCELTNDYEFCFGCGKQIKNEKYIINFGSDATTFTFSKTCIKRIKNKIDKVLE